MGTDMMNQTAERDHDDSRRTFLSTCLTSLAGLTVIGVIAPTLAGCVDSITGVDANYEASFDVSSLTTDNTALITTSKGGDGFPVIIVRQSSTAYIALSTQCTHEGCQVSAPQGSVISCACHGSQFNLTGGVTRGPASQSLYKYATSYDSSKKLLTVKAA
jgi:Rieske Fe-S protein